MIANIVMSFIGLAGLIDLTGCGGSSGNLCTSNAISTRQVTSVATGSEALEFQIKSVSATKTGGTVVVSNPQPLVGATYIVRKVVGNQEVLRGTIRSDEVIHLDNHQVLPGEVITIEVAVPDPPQGQSAYGTDASTLGLLQTAPVSGEVIRTTINYVSGGWDGTGQTCKSS